ncbi:MAG: hypothetical protein WA634_11910 [Silvibacterium sp.]
MKLIPILTMAVLAIPCCAQAGRKAEIFSGNAVASQMATLMQTARASGSGDATLGNYESHAIKLSVRTTSGGAEVHAHYDDIFFVTQGKATLITGGTVVDAKNGADGETEGSRIQSGTSRTIVKGDIVHIPAGTPHQLILAPGASYSAIVIKVKEAK